MPTLDDRLAVIGDALEHGARLRAARQRGRRRAARVAAIAVAALALTAGVALATSSLLGGPAPADVQSAIDGYWPDDPGDTMAPAPGGARAVAEFGDDVLYALPARDGRSACFTILLAHLPRSEAIPGEGCIARSPDATQWLPIGIHVGGTSDHRELISGQVVAPPGATFWIEPAGEPPMQIPLGIDGYFLAERKVDDQRKQNTEPPMYPAKYVLRDKAGNELHAQSFAFQFPGKLIAP
jgi:hypothetical protein